MNSNVSRRQVRSAPDMEQRRGKIKKIWMALYLLLGGAIPLLLFLFEFSASRPAGMEPKLYNKFIVNVIKAYSPLFLYACIGGFLLPSYVVPAYQYLKSIEVDEKIRRIMKVFARMALGVALLVAVFDFFGGEPAIWEVKPPHHQQFINHFMYADTLIKKFPSTVIMDRTVHDSLEKIEKISSIAKEHYKNKIVEELGKGRWSVTRYSYFFSVVIEAFFLVSYFFLCFFYYALRRRLKIKDETLYRKQVNGLILSSLLIWFWLILRTMNSLEKDKIYPDHDLQVANAAVGMLNIICLIITVIAGVADSKIRKATESLISIFAAIGISAGSIVGFFNSDILVDFFGKKAGIQNYIVFPIVFLLLGGAFFILSLRKYDLPEPPADNNRLE
jgi:MFS family permease